MEAKQMKEHREQLFSALGVQLQFLVQPNQSDGSTSLYRGTLPPGITIPLHSHPEAELLYVLEGELEVYQNTGTEQTWSTFQAGDSITIRGNVKHAIRNGAPAPAITLLVTGEQLYGFFREIVRPISGPPSPPTPEDLQRLFSAAAKYHYWLGSPEENANIGITLAQ